MSLDPEQFVCERSGPQFPELDSCYNSKGFLPSIQICALSSVG